MSFLEFITIVEESVWSYFIGNLNQMKGIHSRNLIERFQMLSAQKYFLQHENDTRSQNWIKRSLINGRGLIDWFQREKGQKATPPNSTPHCSHYLDWLNRRDLELNPSGRA